MSFIELHSGHVMDCLNPKPSDFKLEDIAISLSRMPRFGGHTRLPYSVLNHSINCYYEAVSRGYDIEDCKLALCHDFSESTCIDLPRPFKIQLPKYNEIELLHQNAIYERFNINGDHNLLKEVDYDMAVYEARVLMPSAADDDRWEIPNRKSPCEIVNIRLEDIPNVDSELEKFFCLCGILGIK